MFTCVFIIVANPVYSGHLVRAKLAFGPYERWLLLQESKAKERRERKEAGGASGRLYVQAYGSRAFLPTVTIRKWQPQLPRAYSEPGPAWLVQGAQFRAVTSPPPSEKPVLRL